jgi:hypothetical protein
LVRYFVVYSICPPYPHRCCLTLPCAASIVHIYYSYLSVCAGSAEDAGEVSQTRRGNWQMHEKHLGSHDSTAAPTRTLLRCTFAHRRRRNVHRRVCNSSPLVSRLRDTEPHLTVLHPAARSPFSRALIKHPTHSVLHSKPTLALGAKHSSLVARRGEALPPRSRRDRHGLGIRRLGDARPCRFQRNVLVDMAAQFGRDFLRSSLTSEVSALVPTRLGFPPVTIDHSPTTREPLRSYPMESRDTVERGTRSDPPAE